MGAVRFNLTAFADEISSNLDEQVEAMTRLGVRELDLRSVDGINVLDLSLDQLQRTQETLHEHGIKVSCVGSPVNKVKFDVMTQAREFDRLKHACYVAQRMNTTRVRIFTPEVPDERDEEAATQVLAWMSEQRRLAQDQMITLLHENDARYWGAYPDNSKRLFDELGGPNFKAAFDFANTVLLGYRPMQDWFPWLVPHLDTLHIKDAVALDKKVVAAGEGDGQIEETLRFLIGQGWNGNLTIEPHLQAAGPMGGFSGAQLFEKAVTSLRGVLGKAGGEA
jgi:sugar phosphate isomerase/epimerase